MNELKNEHKSENKIKVISFAAENHVGLQNLKTSIEKKQGWDFHLLGLGHSQNEYISIMTQFLETLPPNEWIIVCCSLHTLCVRSSTGCELLLEALGKEIIWSSNELFAGRVRSVVDYLTNNSSETFEDTDSMFFYQDQNKINYELQDDCSLRFPDKILSPYFIQFHDVVLSNPWTKIGQEQQLFSISPHYRLVGTKTNGLAFITQFSPEQEEFVNITCTERIICICFLFLLCFWLFYLLIH